MDPQLVIATVSVALTWTRAGSCEELNDTGASWSARVAFGGDVLVQTSRG